MKTINCKICGKEIAAIWFKRQYCSACRKIRDDELQQQRSAKKKQERLKTMQKKWLVCVADPNKWTLCV
jgi:hypothetical protein